MFFGGCLLFCSFSSAFLCLGLASATVLVLAHVGCLSLVFPHLPIVNKILRFFLIESK